MADTLVIVVTFNGMEWVERCVGSVMESSHPADLIVIDNNSSDGTAQWLEDHSRTLGFTYRRAGANLGFGAANNIGLRHALDNGYRFVYLLNQDAWIHPDTIGNMISALEDSKGCGWGIVSPVQTQADGATPDRNFARHCGRAVRRKEPVVEVDFVMAAHWLLTRECIEKTGGFSPAFRLYGEDDDYIFRARYHGFGVGVVPGACAVHDRAGRPDDGKRRMKLKLIGCRSRACDPGKPFLLSFCLQTAKLAGMAIKNLSMDPVRFIPQFISEYASLKESHDKARTEGAFM